MADSTSNGDARGHENGLDRGVEFASFSSGPPHSGIAGAGRSAREVSMNPLWDSAKSLPSEDESGKLWRIDRSRFEIIQMDEEKEDGMSMSRLFQQGRKNSVSGYYEKQKETIQGFSEMDALEERLIPSADEERASEQLEKSETFAINLSNITNVFLLIAKVVCSVESGSLSIIASTLDSLLDLLSGFILWFTARSMKKSNPYRYPIGKKRMQPLGIIVFASIMATLGLQILLEGVRQLIQGKPGDHDFANEWQWIVGVMVSASVVKLFLFLYCSTFTNDIVRAYAMDHFFDVVTNVIGLAAALLARKYKWWIDPVGAILLALYTMKNWGSTVLEHVNSLTGQSAPPEFLQKLTYLCWNHHEKIIQIDTVRAYTFGSHYFVEVDIVLPEEMPLRVAHDIGESLQNKMERVPEIERAFVHLDFEVSHKPEHHQVARFRPSG